MRCSDEAYHSNVVEAAEQDARLKWWNKMINRKQELKKQKDVTTGGSFKLGEAKEKRLGGQKERVFKFF